MQFSSRNISSTSISKKKLFTCSFFFFIFAAQFVSSAPASFPANRRDETSPYSPHEYENMENVDVPTPTEEVELDVEDEPIEIFPIEEEEPVEEDEEEEVCTSRRFCKVS